MAYLRFPFLSRFPRNELFYSTTGVWLRSVRHKWVSRKDVSGPAVQVGAHGGHPDNPEFHTRDREYLGSPEKGDPILPRFLYREPRASKSYLDRTMTYYLSALFWFWMIYNFYHHPGHVFGHFHAPYLNEFTDEELGIPPDNYDDPEYWGNHYEMPGTYR